MTISVTRHGKAKMTCGKVNRLVILGHGIQKPLNVKFKDIKSIVIHPDKILIDDVEYAGIREFIDDILAARAVAQKRMEKEKECFYFCSECSKYSTCSDFLKEGTQVKMADQVEQ